MSYSDKEFKDLAVLQFRTPTIAVTVGKDRQYER